MKEQKSMQMNDSMMDQNQPRRNSSADLSGNIYNI